MIETLSDLNGTHWRGQNELWLDPLGNEATMSECSLSVEGDRLSYRWQHAGKQQQGELVVNPDGAAFTDSFHSESTMMCRRVEGARGLFQVEGSYGPEGDWGWRIALVYRAPLDQLVLQMTNIAPWGEEARAVRMILSES